MLSQLIQIHLTILKKKEKNIKFKFVPPTPVTKCVF